MSRRVIHIDFLETAKHISIIFLQTECAGYLKKEENGVGFNSVYKTFYLVSST